jgi:hypothetical protein
MPPDLVVEENEPDGVALPQHEIGESGGELGGVGELGDRAGAVAHRPARVEKDVRAEVRLLLVLLHVELVRLGVDFPVDVAQGIAGHVLAVLGELDAEAAVRALVEPRHEALDDEPRLDVHPGEAGHDLRVEESARLVGSDHRSSRGTVSRRRFTMASASTPSASALKFVTMRWRRTAGATRTTSSTAGA